MDSLNDFSVTIPYINVTITKDVALAYAKSHAQNGGPVYTTVFMALALVIMTLVFLYLALCSCLCSIKRAATPRVTPGSPPYSPDASPGRSSMPLRGQGQRSSNKYADEGGVGVEMGGGGGSSSGVTPRSPYALGRVGSWEAERRTYSFRCLYVCSGLFSAFLLICILGVFASQSKFDGSVRLLAGEAEDLILGTANALCTSAENAPRACVPRSAGKFIQTAENTTTGILGDTLGLVGSLDDRVLPYLNSTIDELTAARAQLEALSAVAARINANVTEIEQYRAWLLEAASPSVASGVPQGSLPNVTADQLKAVDDATANVDEGLARAQEVYGNVTDFVARELPRLEQELDPETGSTARQLLDPLERVLASVYDARDRAMAIHGQAQDGEETYAPYLSQKTWILTVVFLVPLLVQLVVLVANHTRCSKSSGHLVGAMCCHFFCLLLFCLVALVMAALAAVSSTACEYHLQLIDRAVKPQNITVDVGGEQEEALVIQVTPALVKAVLNCPGGAQPVATPTNNFVSLLGAERLFNVTGQAEDAIQQIEDARGSFSPEAQIRLALAELEAMGNGTQAFNASEAAASLPAYRQDLAALLADLPPEPLDRDNATQRDRLDHYYLGEKEPAFSWLIYGANVTAVNAILATADPATPLPPGFAPVNTFQTMHNFTRAAVQQHAAEWQAVRWTGGAQGLAELEAQLRLADPYTAAVNEAEAANAEARLNLTRIDADLALVEGDVAGVDAGQGALGALQRSVNNTLHLLLGEVQAVEAGLDGEEGAVRELAAYVGTAPEYAKCGFVGDFYREGFQAGFCGGFHGSASVSWPFMLGAALCLLVSFLTFACFVRKPDWYTDPSYDLRLDRNALTPGHTPHGGAYVVA